MGGIVIITVSPFIIGTIVLAVLTSCFELYIVAFISAFLHETGHLITAFILGYSIEKITILPVGINGIIKDEIINKTHNFVIAAAGPCVNLIIALVASYFKLYDLAICNIYMLVLNLLPIVPLDGGRIFCSFYENDEVNKIVQFCAYSVVIITLLIDFLNNKTINISLIWVLLFTCDVKHTHSIKKSDKVDTIVVPGDSYVWELLKNKNCNFLIYDGSCIVGILKYEDIYNAAIEGLYYLNTNELITERIKNGYPKVR